MCVGGGDLNVGAVRAGARGEGMCRRTDRRRDDDADSIRLCALPPPMQQIGNYSDGNLVASLLAHRMFVTQCNIVRAVRGRGVEEERDDELARR